MSELDQTVIIEQENEPQQDHEKKDCTIKVCKQCRITPMQQAKLDGKKKEYKQQIITVKLSKMPGYLFAVKVFGNTIEQLGRFNQDYRNKQYPAVESIITSLSDRVFWKNILLSGDVQAKLEALQKDLLEQQIILKFNPNKVLKLANKYARTLVKRDKLAKKQTA